MEEFFGGLFGFLGERTQSFFFFFFFKSVLFFFKQKNHLNFLSGFSCVFFWGVLVLREKKAGTGRYFFSFY